MAAGMQVAVGGMHFGRDPGAGGMIAARGAGRHHLAEGAVEANFEAAIPERFREAA
jgi:hypothetical protein